MGSRHPARLIGFLIGRISPYNQASRLYTPVTIGNPRDHHPSISKVYVCETSMRVTLQQPAICISGMGRHVHHMVCIAVTTLWQLV